MRSRRSAGRPASRFAAGAGLCWVALALAAGGCSSSNPSDAKISPLPSGYQPRPPGESRDALRADPNDLDRQMAVVEGRPITLRRLIREVGGRAPGMDDVQFERHLHNRLKDLVREELFVHEARRAGLHVPPQLLDQNVELRKRAIADEASKSAGRPVAFEEVLVDRGLTEAEFREQVRRGLLLDVYWRRVLQGIGGTKPQVEMDVSPAEIRRIYRDHPGAFDVPRGVRLAVFMIAIEPLIAGGRTYTEAEQEAHRRAEEIAAGFRAGEASSALAQRLSLTAGQWREAAEFREDVPPGLAGPDGRTWILSEERRPRDAAVFQIPGVEVVVGIVEIRPPSRRNWEEVQREIVEAVRQVRRLRVNAGMLIEILSRPNAVVPQSLADEMIVEARQRMRQLEDEPVLGTVRFQ